MAFVSATRDWSEFPLCGDCRGWQLPVSGNSVPHRRTSAMHAELFERAERLVNSSSFQSSPTDTYLGLCRRLERIKNAGLPPMRVVRLSTLSALGRIPRSTEGHAVDALEEVRRHGPAERDRLGNVSGSPPKAQIIFFSHRWERPYHCAQRGKDLPYGTDEWQEAIAQGHQVGFPDSADNAKAKGLIQWGKQELWEHGKIMEGLQWHIQRRRMRVLRDLSQLPTEVLFFIDYTCVDQENPRAEISALPCYISACSEILVHYDPQYFDRAWCRMEMMMAYALIGGGKLLRNLREAALRQHHGNRDERAGGDPQHIPPHQQQFPQHNWGTSVSEMWKDDGEDVVAVIRAGDHGNGWSETLTLLDPEEGSVTNPGDRTLIAQLTKCAKASNAFGCWGTYRFRNLGPCCHFEPSCSRVAGLIVYTALCLPCVFKIYCITGPYRAYVTRRSVKVGETRFILKDRHSYRWGHAEFQPVTVTVSSMR